MKPKKQSNMGFIVGVIIMVAVLFLAAHFAGAYKDVVDEYGEVKDFSVVGLYYAAFENRLKTPLSIEWNEYSQQILIYSGLICFIAIAYIVTSKKNTIAGKEHGTARWGRRGDIQSLFADNILKKELSLLSKRRNIFTRPFAKRSVIKRCDCDGMVLKAGKVAALKLRAEQERAEGRYNRKLYNEDMRAIGREVRDVVRDAKLAAWKPLRLKADYDIAVKGYKDSRRDGRINDKEMNDGIKAAAKEYRSNLTSFYKGFGESVKLKTQYHNADSLFTQSERISIHNYEVNNNVLILGGSGSGKTRGFVMPNILQAHSSYVITDPKGEILEKSGKFLSEFNGYKIRVLNLDNKALSDGYNPFVYIHPEREGYEERVLTLIKTIIINTDGGEKRNSSDPFWEKAEELFLQAIFFFVCDGFILKDRNMNTVLELIAMLDLKEDQDDCTSELDYFAAYFAELYGKEHIGVQQYNEFRTKASGKTAKSIVISAVARLAPFRTTAIKRLFSYDTMDLHRLGEEKMAIFVVVPPTDKTFNFIAGMLFTQMFQELQYCATEVHKHEGQRLPVPVRFVLDEFANTCTIPNFVQILAYARSFGVGIVPILQSLEQIKNMYKDEWGVIVDNCATRLYLGSISHMETLEYVSKMLGKGTFDKRSTGRTRGRQGTSSQNWDVIGRELLDAAEIGKLPKEDCLLLVANRPPFYSKKYDYTTHPNYRYTSDGNRSYSFYYEPAPIPAQPTAEKRTPQITHGEGLTPSANAIVATQDIEFMTEPKKILSDMVSAGNNNVPIPNSYFPNDGEPKYSDDETDALFALLYNEEDDKVVSEVMRNTSSIELNTDTAVIAASMVSTAAYQTPIPNGTLSVPDGEPVFSVSETEYIGDYQLDDDEALSVVIEEEIGMSINALIDMLPEDMADTVRTDAQGTVEAESA